MKFGLGFLDGGVGSDAGERGWKTVTVSATSPDSSVTVGSGSVTVQGTLSGVLPAGTVVPITGTGFTSSTTVSIDGVVVSSTEFVSATEIDVTIGGSTELVGKLARVTDSGVEFEYFCFRPNDLVNFLIGWSHRRLFVEYTADVSAGCGRRILSPRRAAGRRGGN